MNHMAGKTSEAGDAGLRRDRLELLKARRQTLADPAAELSFGVDPAKAPAAAPRPAAALAPASSEAPAPGKSGLLTSLLSGKLAGGKAARAQMLAKAMQLLTKTPPDADGMIAGTPFSSAGLTLVVALLRKRAEGAAAGSKAVLTVLGFLQATAGEAATPQGLSLAKVQLIAQKIGGAAAAGAAVGPKAPAGFAAPAPAVASRPKFAAAGGIAGGGFAGGGGPAQRQMLGKLHYMLTNTPADARGMVPGTGFSQAGVSKLMAMLHQRADAQGTQGGKMAARVLDMIAAAPGETGVIDGASMQKLAALAARLERGG